MYCNEWGRLLKLAQHRAHLARSFLVQKTVTSPLDDPLLIRLGWWQCAGRLAVDTWTVLYDPCAIRVTTSLQRLDIAKGSYAYCTITGDGGCFFCGTASAD